MAVILFSGPELFLKEEALNTLKEHSVSDRSRSFNCSIFYGEDPGKDISGTLNTVGFFDEKKFVVIKNVERLSAHEKEHLLNYIKKPSPQIHLVLETADANLDGDFLSRLAGYARVTKFNKLYGTSLYSWVCKRVHGYKKKISKEAADLLAELLGKNLRFLAMELDKLVIYVGDRAWIQKGDVENLTGRGLNQDVFDLINAVSQRDCQRSLDLISLLTTSKKRESEIIRLLGWQFKRLWKAKELQKKKIPNFNIARSLKVPTRYAERFFNQLNRLDSETVEKNLNILVEADRDIKTGRRDTRLVLELLIVRLCSA